ncbi:Mbov_0398 family ICE element protein [Mesomycoplasma ovipneumoniae]|uniref:Mbov_0398 family ICE element protein n=1 Tax=Mesomycoplasma ovipneumoniae TaxID=29562 RepID=UPI003080B2CA
MTKNKNKKKNIEYKMKNKKTQRAALFLQFTNPDEAKLIDDLKFKILQNGKKPTVVIKDFLIEILQKENFQKSFSEVKNDVFYSFRKASYISQIPFYLKLDEFRKENELMIDLLNKKVNLLINLLYEFTKKDIAEFSPNDTENFYYFQKLEEDMSVKIAHLKSKNASKKREMEVFYDNFKNYDENTENNTNDFVGEK